MERLTLAQIIQRLSALDHFRFPAFRPILSGARSPQLFRPCILYTLILAAERRGVYSFVTCRNDNNRGSNAAFSKQSIKTCRLGNRSGGYEACGLLAV